MASHPFPADPWKVIHLRGGDREMGRQHAEQVGPACRNGMPSFYHALLGRLLNRRPSDWADRVVLSAVKKAMDPLLVNRLLRQVPQATREVIEGFAQAADLPVRELEVALVLPDLLPLVTGALSRVFPGRFVEAMPEVRMGCSSFVSSGSQFLVARNLDFPGVGYWDRYPVIQHQQPIGRLASVSFTSAGVAVGGITGVNEAQVFVALHQHYSRSLSLSGQLPFIIAQKILAEARTLEEAVAILQRNKVSSSWAFILADGKTREGAIWEATPNACGIRRLHPGDPILAHSNFFQTPECRPSEYSMSERMNWDNFYRKSRLQSLVANAGGELTPGLAAKAISDHFDPFWGEEKIVNRIVSQSFNIQSLVLDPESMQVWVASGDSPVHLQNFDKFDLGEIFQGKEGRTSGQLPGFRFHDDKMALAKRAFVLSVIYAMDGDEEKALQAIEASLEAEFTPEVGLTASVLAMKAGQWEKAEGLLATAVEKVERKLAQRPETKTPPEYYEMRLYQGRLCDLQGQRSAARGHYRAIAESKDLEDVNLKRLARMRGPYNRKMLDRMLLPYSTYAPLA